MGGSDSPRHAWEDAPSKDEYHIIKEHIQENIDKRYREECKFLFLTMGQLGLRAGEVSHMTRSWIDFDNQLITIPPHETCTDGRDGGMCGSCRAQAHQAHDRYGRSLQEALDERWKPKMDASARTIPYGWSNELEKLFARFFYDNPEGYEHSRASVNRRIDQIAEATDVIDDKDDLYPHALRAYAGIKHARNGIGAYQLTDFMGWESIKGAIPYIELAANDVVAAFNQQYNNHGGIWQ